MFDRQKVIAALERKRSHFTDFTARQREQESVLEKRLQQFFTLTQHEIERTLFLAGDPWPGAYPTEEWEAAQQLCIPFGESWTTHQDARAWALEILRDCTVIAVDGSQITPTKDFSAPVGAVQIGWFINQHRPDGLYVKDIAFDLLAPGEWQDESDDPDSPFPSSEINLQRFRLECLKLCELMQTYRVVEPSTAEQLLTDSTKRPLCLFDGSFIISFAGRMHKEPAGKYVNAVEEMLNCSKNYRVPLLGFVDSSFSHDLSSMLHRVTAPSEIDPKKAVTDGVLMMDLLPHWGDRSPFFLCARSDALSRHPAYPDRAEFYKDVAFCYIRLASERPPARLEIPRWLLEAGWAEEVVNVVRAECIVGVGYPYALETADATAVISQQDRQKFYGLFQQFLEQQGLTLTQTRKMRSKLARR